MFQVVRLLVGAGADPNEPIPSGETPLTYAARKKFTDLTQMLIQCKYRKGNKSAWRKETWDIREE